MADIKYVKMYNFYNYFGDDNIYEFHNGMNVIIADNNGSKSKLYNAFLLVISNEVIDSDSRKKKSLVSKIDKFKVISDRAKKEAEQNDVLITGVELAFETETYIFTFNKTFVSKKLNQKSPYNLENWNIGDLKTNIKRKNKRSRTTQAIDIADEQEKLDSLLPFQLRQYCMFQGEEVVNLVDSGLTNAINKLTDLRKFRYFENFLLDIYNKFDKKLRNEEKSSATNQHEANRLENSIEHIEENIKLAKFDLSERNEQLINVKESIDKLSRLINEATKQSNVYTKYGKVSQRLSKIASDIEDFEKNYNQSFFSNKWILKGFSEYAKKFDLLRSEYEDDLARQRIQEFKTLLPQDSPDIPSLKKMLEEEICLVCGRKAPENSEAYMHISKLKDEHEMGKKSKRHSPIKLFCDSLYREISNIPLEKGIDESIKMKADKLKMLRKLNSELSDEKNELSNKLITNKEENEKILNDYQTKVDQKGILKKTIDNIEKNLAIMNADLRSKKKQLSNLSKNDLALKPLKNSVQILEDLLEIFKKTRKRFYVEEAVKFEESINNIYKSLTMGNETNPGNVKISVDSTYNFSANLINSEGGSLSGQGAAFQRMKQLAIVMGLMNKSRRSASFPLIADAPISEMGEILTQNFFYNIPNVFIQSIIFIKDFYGVDGDLNVIGKNIINNPSLNIRAFLNTAIGKEQHERKTEIKLIHTEQNGEQL